MVEHFGDPNGFLGRRRCLSKLPTVSEASGQPGTRVYCGQEVQAEALIHQIALQSRLVLSECRGRALIVAQVMVGDTHIEARRELENRVSQCSGQSECLLTVGHRVSVLARAPKATGH